MRGGETTGSQASRFNHFKPRKPTPTAREHTGVRNTQKRTGCQDAQNIEDKQLSIHWKFQAFCASMQESKLSLGTEERNFGPQGWEHRLAQLLTEMGLEFLRNTGSETRNTIQSSDTTSEESRRKHTTRGPAGWGLAPCESQSPGYRTGLRAVHSGMGKENVMHIYTSPTRVWLCHRAERGRAPRTTVDGSTEHGLKEN